MNFETLIRFADVGLCVRSPRGRGRWVGICKRYVQNFEFRPTSHTVECRAKSPSGPERGMVSGALRAACAHAEEPGAWHFDARCRRHRCVARIRREDRVVACCRDPTSEDQAESTGGVDGSGDNVTVRDNHLRGRGHSAMPTFAHRGGRRLCSTNRRGPMHGTWPMEAWLACVGGVAIARG